MERWTLGVTVPMQEEETPEQEIVSWIQEERATDNQHTRRRINLVVKSWLTEESNNE